MDTRGKALYQKRFLILVPHRDSLKTFYEYRKKLFAGGFYGAYSFPPAAPLAALSKPLVKEELKELALRIREETKASGGKIFARGNSVLPCGEISAQNAAISFFGLNLSLPVPEKLFPESAKSKISNTFFPFVLCAALSAGAETREAIEGPALSFRAAYVANLTIQAAEGGEAGYSFEWKSGIPVWLPAFKGARHE